MTVPAGTSQRRGAVRVKPEILVAAITLGAFAVRVYHLGYQSLWRDESDALRFATQALPDFFKMFSAMGQNGPLFFLMLRPWLAVAGHSEFALRFLSAACGTLAVPVAYRLLRSLAGRRPALLLAVLMAVAPYLVWYGQEAKMYALLTLLIPLSLWLAILAVRRSRWYDWVGLYLVTSLAVYNHLLVPLIIPVQVVWLLLAPPKEPEGDATGAGATQAVAIETAEAGAPDTNAAENGKGRAPAALPARRGLKVLIYLAALGLPYLPILRWAVPLLLNGYHSGFEFVPLPQMLATLVGGWSRGILPNFGPTALPMLLGVVAGSFFWSAAGGRAGQRVVVMLLAWLVLPPLEIYLISL
ncbi:MAG TPA: glycosyltransferase family 39 protein, partial [Anaerolineae bacterium]